MIVRGIEETAACWIEETRDCHISDRHGVAQPRGVEGEGVQLQEAQGNRGVVLEYRYDEYVCATLGTLACGFTDVGIPNFQSPPWSAPATALMHGADWRTDCDGGLIVGGDDAYGLIAAFQLEGGVDCGW